MTETTGDRSGTFVVSSTDETAVVLQDVATAQIHTVSAEDLTEALAEESLDAVGTEPGAVDPGTVLAETTIVPAADGIQWTIESLGEVRWIPVERVELEPTKRSRETARKTDTGSLETHERAGTGSVHVLSVPPDRIETAATEISEDPATRRRAARMGIDRVEIRTGTTDGSAVDATAESDRTGVVSVRYLPK